MPHQSFGSIIDNIYETQRSYLCQVFVGDVTNKPFEEQSTWNCPCHTTEFTSLQ